MNKAIQIDDVELLRAIQEGADYLIAGKRRFLLVEVPDPNGQAYDVGDPAETQVVKEALHDNSLRLEGEAARKYLKARLKDYGVHRVD
ncbi:MAG: hypothetical protein M1598_01145 [Actinobacteria bacterium]|nr:hypothetical protein [Actinomycetota bacterium]